MPWMNPPSPARVSPWTRPPAPRSLLPPSTVPAIFSAEPLGWARTPPCPRSLKWSPMPPPPRPPLPRLPTRYPVYLFPLSLHWQLSPLPCGFWWEKSWALHWHGAFPSWSSPAPVRWVLQRPLPLWWATARVPATAFSSKPPHHWKPPERPISLPWTRPAP